MSNSVLLENKTLTPSKHRDIVIDLIKTIAIFGVLTIHASTGANADPVGSFDWLCGNFYGCLTRASVPLFIMCSGALFLSSKKELSLKKLFSKNILRLIVAMLFWATAYKVYNLIEMGNLSAVNLFSDIKNVLFFNQEFHLYYIHMILLIYVLLPVLRIFADNADKRTLVYALAIWFVLGVLFPTVAGFWPFTLLKGIPLQWRLNLTYNAVGYFLFGHYLKKYPVKLPTAIISAVLGFGILYGGTVLMSIKNGQLYAGFIDGMTAGSFFLAAGIFGICTCAEPLIGTFTKKVTNYVSNASFCIYLVHMFILYEMEDLKLNVASLPIPAIVSVPAVMFVCFAVSLGIYFILSHIPVVKKWLV